MKHPHIMKMYIFSIHLKISYLLVEIQSCHFRWQRTAWIPIWQQTHQLMLRRGVLSTSWCTYRFMGVDCIRSFWIIWVFIMYMSLDRGRVRDDGIMQIVETRCDTIMDSIMFAFWSNVLWCSVGRVSWQLGTWSAPRQKAWDYLKWSGGFFLQWTTLTWPSIHPRFLRVECWCLWLISPDFH